MFFEKHLSGQRCYNNDAADMLQSKSTFYSAHSQKTFFNSAVRKELPKFNKKELAPSDTSFNKLKNCNPLEKHYLDHEKLIYSDLKTETALAKVILSEIPPNGAENYSYLQRV